jgi:type I restriction enzyme S subunit
MSDDVPSGWSSIRLREICQEVETRIGKSTKLPLLSVTKRGVIPQSDTYGKEIASADASNYKVVLPGQFAMAPMALYYGAIGRFNGNLRGMISPAYNVFVEGDGIDAKYLEALIRLPRMVGRYEALSQGGNIEGKRKNTSFSDFGSIKVNVPSYPEQLAIAEVMQSVDADINGTRDLLKSLANAKFAVMRDLLTRGKRRGAAPLQPLSERWVLGRVAGDITHIPSDWGLVRLTSVAKLESGHTPDRKRQDYWGGDIPWLSLGDTNGLGGLTVSTTTECVTQLGINNSSARVLPADTVVFSRTATVGKATRLAVPMATSQDFANWICGPKLCPRYLVQVFRHMIREWDRLEEGSTHQTIYMPVFKKLQILLPPKDEQSKIADAGEAFDLRIEAEQRKLAELANVRAALARELLSGRLRLPSSMVARFANDPAQPMAASA